MGLPSTFRIINGKFEFIGGADKADDSLQVLIRYIGWLIVMK